MFSVLFLIVNDAERFDFQCFYGLGF